jgi:hypothetical protein
MNDKAVADCATAIVLSPDNEEGYACRGTAHFDAGDPANAEADFRRSLGIEPCQPEILMRLLVVAKKNGSRLEAKLICHAVASAEAETWPAPLLAFLLGTAPDSRKRLEAGLFPGGGKTPVPERHCEASFFIGEAELAVGGGRPRAEAPARSRNRLRREPRLSGQRSGRVGANARVAKRRAHSAPPIPGTPERFPRRHSMKTGDPENR